MSVDLPEASFLLATAMLMRRAKSKPLTDEQREIARLRDEAKAQAALKLKQERAAKEHEEMLRSPRAYRRRQAKKTTQIEGGATS